MPKVKNGLRFLLPVLFIAIAFVCDAWGCAPVLQATDPVIVDSEDNPQSIEVLESFPLESDLQLPRRFSGVSAPRLQNVVNRTYNTFRNNIEFLKAGKVVYAGFKSSIHKESLNLGYLLVKPCHRLTWLGKLII